eukprot:4670263-Ditylum_brightwellii.AAC.1
MDASDTQLRGVISQQDTPIAFYMCKLNNAQKNYIPMENELLAIVEILKEFKNLLLGQQSRVYTDHKNLMYKNFNTTRVIQWHMFLDDYMLGLIYIPGNKNIIANTLS